MRAKAERMVNDGAQRFPGITFPLVVFVDSYVARAVRFFTHFSFFSHRWATMILTISVSFSTPYISTGPQLVHRASSNRPGLPVK